MTNWKYTNNWCVEQRMKRIGKKCAVNGMWIGGFDFWATVIHIWMSEFVKVNRVFDFIQLVSCDSMFWMLSKKAKLNKIAFQYQYNCLQISKIPSDCTKSNPCLLISYALLELPLLLTFHMFFPLTNGIFCFHFS